MDMQTFLQLAMALQAKQAEYDALQKDIDTLTAKWVQLDRDAQALEAQRPAVMDQRNAKAADQSNVSVEIGKLKAQINTLMFTSPAVAPNA